MNNEDFTPEQVESAAVRRLSKLAHQLLEIQAHVQHDAHGWLEQVLDGATEVRVEITMMKGSGGTTVRLLGLDGEGTESPIRTIELTGASSH